jgi:hypothetical protein
MQLAGGLKVHLKPDPTDVACRIQASSIEPRDSLITSLNRQ